MSFDSSDTIFALVDCNNFYASCERVFNPKLEAQPIIVLSNNDGCVIARSNEAKALKIKMGQPFFQIRSLCERYDVHVFSSNFALYGDMSQRVMQTLARFSPDIEVYSIDEAFLRLDRLAEKPMEIAKKIRTTVLKELGIPVSVGIGPTKTLAKLANAIAKKQQCRSVYQLNPDALKPTLSQCPVDMIWGIGRRWADQLRQLNIHNAWQLASQPEARMKALFSVVMARMIQELNGRPTLAIEDLQPRKNILCSRSFSMSITQCSDLLSAISHFAANASVKARKQGSLAQGIGVFTKCRYQQPEPEYFSQHFSTATAKTQEITRIAKQLGKRCFQAGKSYRKAGVILLDMIPNQMTQHALDFEETTEQSEKISELLDTINNRFGRQTAFLAAEGTQQVWRSERQHISQRYTSNWDELPPVL